MVLELRAPREATAHALAAQAPVFLSYALFQPGIGGIRVLSLARRGRPPRGSREPGGAPPSAAQEPAHRRPLRERRSPGVRVGLDLVRHLPLDPRPLLHAGAKARSS